MTRWLLALLLAGAAAESGERLRAEFSSYCGCNLCCGVWRDGILVKPATGLTKLERKPVQGWTITCPSWLELGTLVRVEIPDLGRRIFACLDRGPERAEDGTWQFDVFQARHADALAAFGGRGRVRGVVEVLGGASR